MPGECFPTRYRSTSHGFSAGMGKIGSIIGQAGIAKLRTKGAVKNGPTNPYQGHVMEIYSLFMFLGIFTTLCIPETKRKTLEELSGDDIGAPLVGDGHHANGDAASEEAAKEPVAGAAVV